MRWRYGQKIGIKTAEAVAKLLQTILAPGASSPCDERCPHMARGARAEQVSVSSTRSRRRSRTYAIDLFRCQKRNLTMLPHLIPPGVSGEAPRERHDLTYHSFEWY